MTRIPVRQVKLVSQPTLTGARWPHPLAAWRQCGQHQHFSAFHHPPRTLLTVPLSLHQVQRQWGSSLRASAADDPTIYALSTAPGRAAIAIIRISGPRATDVYRSLCPSKQLPQPRLAAVRCLYDPRASSTNEPRILDPAALTLFFPAPNTVTGEDVLEFHVHGGSAIVKAVLNAIACCNTPQHSVRYAEPGEFTRRAFFNNRMTLPQIEALGDTLSAVTEEQRRLAVQGTVSGLAARYDSWRKLLLEARGELEALIDFSEDQHFDETPAELTANVAAQVRILAKKISLHCANAVRGELLRNGITISLIGSPNVGKSSLLNLAVGRNAAIVSKEAGTTRDVVEVGIDLGGFFCRLGDTAGLRKSSRSDQAQLLAHAVGEIEQEGIRRAKERAAQSDVVILVLSIEPALEGQGVVLSLENEVLETASQLLRDGKRLVAVVNKMDYYGRSQYELAGHVVKSVSTALPLLDPNDIFCVSCFEAQKPSDLSVVDPGSIQTFLAGLTDTFKSLTTALVPNASDLDTSSASDPSQWQESLGATQRQATLLTECASCLERFLGQVDAPQSRPLHSSGGPPGGPNASDHAIDIVMAAEDLRAAAVCLGMLTGSGEASDVEDVLGVVFEKFCVGK